MGTKRRSRREILRTAYRHLQHASEIIKNEYGDTVTPAEENIVSALRDVMLDLEDETDKIFEIQEWVAYDSDKDSDENSERAIAKKAEEVCVKYGRQVMFICPNCGGDAIGVKKGGGAIAVECKKCGINIVVK